MAFTYILGLSYNYLCVGCDDAGEPIHNGMYSTLMLNAPKEAALEFSDYTFKEHFGKPIPSFTPREPMRQYLEGNLQVENFEQMLNR